MRLTGVFLLDLEKLVNPVANITLGDLDIILSVTIIGHQREVAIIGDIELKKTRVSDTNGGCTERSAPGGKKE